MDLIVASAGSPFDAPAVVNARTDVAWLTPPVAGFGWVAAADRPAHIQISASDAGLAPGTYSGNIYVDSPGAENTPVTVPVQFNVYGSSATYPYAYPVTVHCLYTIGLTPSPGDNSTDVLSPSLVFGGENVLSTSVSSSGWLSYNAFSLKCDPAGLVPGLYLGEVDAQMGQQLPGTSIKVPVDFTVTGMAAFALPGSVDILALPGAGTFQAEVVLSDGYPAPFNALPLNITSVVSSEAWLKATTQTNILPAILTITADATGLTAGQYKGSVQVHITGSANPIVTVPVRLTMAAATPLTVSQVSIAYQVPSTEMLSAAKTVVVDSAVPTAFTVSFLRDNLSLDIEPASGVTPATLSINAKGIYLPMSSLETDDIVITTSTGLTQVIPANLSYTTYQPQWSGAGVVNAASFIGPVAPGSIVSVFGSFLSLTTASAAATPLPATLAGTSITINGETAPLFYVSPTQINLQIPPDISSGTATLETGPNGYFNGTYDGFQITVTASAPGIFTWGQNRAAVLNGDDSLNTPQNPAHPGGTVSVYCTGQGALDQPVGAGAPTPSGALIHPLLPVTASIGTTAVDVLFGGMAPGLVGACQVNLLVPDLPPGDYPVAIRVGTAVSNAPVMSIGN